MGDKWKNPSEKEECAETLLGYEKELILQLWSSWFSKIIAYTFPRNLNPFMIIFIFVVHNVRDLYLLHIRRIASFYLYFLGLL